ncbi:MAG: hypothetical protein N2484_06440 [Clostridia bacterium]|nr:hypothetical protein [Clostridia bacterium]
MLIVVAFMTWITAVFTNIYISKLLYGKTYCMIDPLNAVSKFMFVLFAPFISINLFAKYLVRESCKASESLVAVKIKSCINCTHCNSDTCSIYDLKIRNKMLCKGQLYSKLGVHV